MALIALKQKLGRLLKVVCKKNEQKRHSRVVNASVYYPGVEPFHCQNFLHPKMFSLIYPLSKFCMRPQYDNFFKLFFVSVLCKSLLQLFPKCAGYVLLILLFDVVFEKEV